MPLGLFPGSLISSHYESSANERSNKCLNKSSTDTQEIGLFNKHQAPSTKHQAPSTKHQAPSTKMSMRDNRCIPLYKSLRLSLAQVDAKVRFDV
jgi:hypothetical protein